MIGGWREPKGPAAGMTAPETAFMNEDEFAHQSRRYRRSRSDRIFSSLSHRLGFDVRFGTADPAIFD